MWQISLSKTTEYSGIAFFILYCTQLDLYMRINENYRIDLMLAAASGGV